MDVRDHEKILDAVDGVGVYVVREDDRRLLYLSRLVKEAVPEAQVGAHCYEMWDGGCSFCPLRSIGGEQTARSIGYSARFGGMVEMSATRTLWEGQIPAFIITASAYHAKEQETAVQEWAYIISSLSSMFFSTYYVDLEHDSFRVVLQPSKIGSVLGDEVDCSQALKVYAENFIHPEDRENYLSVMNVEQLRQSLGWWNPYVAVEYRMWDQGAEDGSERQRWTRATAVLARSDQDGMPKTVVYVAQDVTENKRKEA